MFVIMLMPAIAILSLGMMPSAASADGGGGLPDGFVYVTDVAPDALLDIRYYGTNNFVGERIDSYLAPVAILTVQAADALKRATDELRNKGFVIKIFDAYRPAAAVAHFARWAADSRDTRKKADFYPDVAKSDLHRKGYIAKRSSHSRGSALDLTIVHADSGREADMGSPFDFFGEISHHGANGITSEQKANRDILRSAMERAGFRALKTEWWHYSLADEPFSDKYFDFPVDGPNPEMAEALDRLALSIPAEKLIVVTGGRSASRVDVRAYERINGVWTLSLRTDGFVGKGGVSDEKREGDGATPSGVYSFGRAFGAADDPGSTTPYTKL
ncbi:MAG: hypothetical protein LBT08_04835, partial [Synergistaceae bacterium]|nr:hypothetical protein [Synergistaceae bacterium]